MTTRSHAWAPNVRQTSAMAADRTLAARVALELQAEIVDRRWPVGEVLGSEAALVQRFAVSRSVIREALRILDSRGIARPKPGPGGGLVVTAPSTDALFGPTRLLLDYRGFTAVHLFEVWFGMEVLMVERLAREITPEGVSDLRKALDEAAHATDFHDCARTLHTEIARVSANPVAEILLCTLSDVFHAYANALDPEQKRRSYLQHIKLIDAIEAGDGLAAAELVRRICDNLCCQLSQAEARTAASGTA